MHSGDEIGTSRAQVRLSALSAIVGALLGFVVNMLHPNLPDDHEKALALVAGHANWGLLHAGIIASTVFVLGGLYGLSRVAHGPLARGLARLGMITAIPGASVMIAGIAIDGYATKGLADLWAGASSADKAVAFHTALAVERVQTALFHTWSALFIGAPFLLLGLSGLVAGGGFPRWLGALGALGGGIALVTGVSGYLGAPLPGLLFTVGAALVTLWVLIAGVVALREPDRPRVTAADPAATPGHRVPAA